MFMSLGDGGGQVLSPLKRGKSFTFGYGSSKGRNKGDIVVVGKGRLTYMGVHYRRI